MTPSADGLTGTATLVGFLHTVRFSTATSTTAPSLGASAPAPLEGCHQAAAELLTIRDKDDDAKDKIAWNLVRVDTVDAADAAELGDPTVSTAYALCRCDSRAIDLSVAPGLFVGEGASWDAVHRGFKCCHQLTTVDGVLAIKLSHGASGKGKVAIRA